MEAWSFYDFGNRNPSRYLDRLRDIINKKSLALGRHELRRIQYVGKHVFEISEHQDSKRAAQLIPELFAWSKFGVSDSLIDPVGKF